MSQEYVKAVSSRSRPYVIVGKVYDLHRGDNLVTEPDYIVGEDGSLCYIGREFDISPHLFDEGYFVECDHAGRPLHKNPNIKLPIPGMGSDEGVELTSELGEPDQKGN